MSEIDSPGPSVPIFKKRTSRSKAVVAPRSSAIGFDDQEVSGTDVKGDDEEAEEESLSLQDLIALRAMRVKPSGIELDRLNKGETRKKKKKQEKKGEETEEDRWAEQMKKGGLVKKTITEDTDKNDMHKESEEDDEDDDGDDEEAKNAAGAPRLVKQNNFQGETGTIDVDKHMMAYIEEEMKKRRQRGELDGSLSDPEKVKAMLNPNDELYSVDEKYRKILQSAKEALEAAKRNVNAGSRAKEEDDKEEGNATLSSAMLNGVPEVDLGMGHRMKNIEETERAKRAMMEAQKNKNRDAREDEEGDFASARFFKYGTKIQSDADIMRTAESLGLHEEGPPLEDNSRRQSEYKRQTATDDAALERFKKRQRNQLKR